MENVMQRTEIYFKSWCPYSQRALALLRSKDIEFKAIDLTHDAFREELAMRRRSDRTSVPQIFVNGMHLGGYDDIAALDASGELDPLLFGTVLSNVA
jgi:GrxC family glutaredoxin